MHIYFAVRDHTPNGYLRYLHCSWYYGERGEAVPELRPKLSPHKEGLQILLSRARETGLSIHRRGHVNGICFLWMPIDAIQISLTAKSKFNTLWTLVLFQWNKPFKKPCKILGSLYPYAKDHFGRVSNTYQEKSGDANCKSLCLQMPNQGLWGVEQEHDRLVVNVDWGDGIQVQSDLGRNKEKS